MLAYLHGEKGAELVADAIAQTAAVSAANWAETLSKVAELDRSPSDVATDLQEQGLLGGLLEIVPLTAEDALPIGELRPSTRDLGLSLGDRACIALALRLGVPVVTADRSWTELERIGIDVDVQPIR
jgi:PIN domain nuclease of toxin-antitoxin system